MLQKLQAVAHYLATCAGFLSLREKHIRTINAAVAEVTALRHEVTILTESKENLWSALKAKEAEVLNLRTLLQATEPVCMAEQMWASFSARYGNTQPAELEKVPALRAAWREWQLAWTAGADAALVPEDDAAVHRNEDAGPPDCPCRDD